MHTDDVYMQTLRLDKGAHREGGGVCLMEAVAAITGEFIETQLPYIEIDVEKAPDFSFNEHEGVWEYSGPKTFADLQVTRTLKVPTDTPSCVAQRLVYIGQGINDALPDADRQALIAYIPRFLGTAESLSDKAIIDATYAALASTDALSPWLYGLGMVSLPSETRALGVEMVRRDCWREFLDSVLPPEPMDEFARTVACQIAPDCEAAVEAEVLSGAAA